MIMHTTSVLLLCLMIVDVCGRGSLYVGFLGYSNPTRRTYDGDCCGVVMSRCDNECRLVFEVSVKGIKNNHTESPSETPIRGSELQKIPSSYDMKNPLSFSFDTWPGKADITVEIYDVPVNSEKKLVDKFYFEFNHGTPELNYINKTKTGERSQNKTTLRMIFRYNCDQFYFGEDCNHTCISDPTKCPTLPSGNAQSITDWIRILTTKKATSRTKCPVVSSGHITQPNISGVDCRNESSENYTTAVVILSELTTQIDVTTQKPGTTQVTTKMLTHSQNTFKATDRLLTTQATPDSSNKTTFVSLVQIKTAKITTPNNFKTIAKRTSSNRNMPATFSVTTTRIIPTVTIPTEHLTTTTLANGGKTGDGDVMHYWPAIVGGVLGGVAIIAVIGVVIYVRKLRAEQQKRHDIYNVNPKTWVLEPHENGTSGMSEIALETELV